MKRSNEMISETTNMTIEEAAEIGALLLNGGAGDLRRRRPQATVADRSCLAQRPRGRTPKTSTRRSGAGVRQREEERTRLALWGVGQRRAGDVHLPTPWRSQRLFAG